MEKNIELAIKDKIATIRFIDQDNFNALSRETAKQLLEVFGDLKDDPTVRCIILTGTGKSFSAGGNIKEFKSSIENGIPGQNMDDLTKDLYKIAKFLRLYPKPVIGAVNGWAVGAGMNLALSCDVIIASENAKFRQSFCKLALIPGFAGSILLSHQLTWQQAVQMSFFGDTYSAEEMKSLGFINEIVPQEKLEEVSLEWANRFAKGPTLTYARTKKLLFDSLSTPFDEQLENERQMQIKSAESEDFKIGVFALVDKKEPDFIGK